MLKCVIFTSDMAANEGFHLSSGELNSSNFANKRGDLAFLGIKIGPCSRTVLGVSPVGYNKRIVARPNTEK